MSPSERELLDRHIRDEVAKSALRSIRRLVDEYEREERNARRMTPLCVGLIVLGVLAVVLCLYVFRFAPGASGVDPQRAATAVTHAAGPLRLDVGAGEDPLVARYGEDFRRSIEGVVAAFLTGVIREKELYGSATLTTRIRSDGTVESVEIVRSSGVDAVDDIARKLVFRAAPFPPFSDALKQRGDSLVLTREFAFVKE